MIHERKETFYTIRETLRIAKRYQGKIFVLVIDDKSFQNCAQLSLVDEITALHDNGIKIILVVGNLIIKDKQKDKCKLQSLSQIQELSTLNRGENSQLPSLEIFSEDNPVPDSKQIQKTIQKNLIPIIGISNSNGKALTKWANTIALETKSEKIIILSEINGIFKYGKILKQLKPTEASQLITDAFVTESMVKIIQDANEAIKNGVKRIHLVSCMEQGNLLMEIFDKDGVGTMIYQGQYREIRPANKKDVIGIVDLINYHNQSGIVRKTSREDILRNLDNFIVIVIDNRIVGCACLQCFESEKNAFVSSVAISPQYVNEGFGDELVQRIEDCARNNRMEKLTLVSPKTGYWWLHQRFVPGKTEQLPNTIQKKYSREKPIVLIKDL